MLSDLQQRVAAVAGAVAGFLPDVVEYWADPDTAETPTAPVANRDPFGFPLRTSAPLAPETGARKIDQCQGQLAPTQQRIQKPSVAGEQTVTLAPWTITVPAAKVAAWNLSKGGELRIGARVFHIVQSGGADSFSPLRLLYCEEQT